MPENSEIPVVPQIDYSEVLALISTDVSYMREHFEKNEGAVPVYQEKLEEVVTLLSDLKVQSSVPTESVDISALTESVQHLEKSVDTVVDINTFSMVGIGLLIGVLCTLIVSQFLRS